MEIYSAVDFLLPVIYDELRRLAANYLRRERPYYTLKRHRRARGLPALGRSDSR